MTWVPIFSTLSSCSSSFWDGNFVLPGCGSDMWHFQTCTPYYQLSFKTSPRNCKERKIALDFSRIKLCKMLSLEQQFCLGCVLEHSFLTWRLWIVSVVDFSSCLPTHGFIWQLAVLQCNPMPVYLKTSPTVLQSTFCQSGRQLIAGKGGRVEGNTR